MFTLSDYIDEFLNSEYFSLHSESHKDSAPVLLEYFCRELEKENFDTLEVSYFDIFFENTVARLDVNVEDKKEYPLLASYYLEYVSTFMGIPKVGGWSEYIQALAPSFRERFRENGTFRGETYKKKYTNVGRNEPCPCGSGKKFKKCCLPLIS